MLGGKKGIQKTLTQNTCSGIFILSTNERV